MSTYPPKPPPSERLGRFARRPFAAALLGGLVVLAGMLVAVSAGWIGKEKTVVQSSIAQPISNSDSAEGPTVQEIYKQDGPGVVFIRSEVVQRSQSPFGLPQTQRGEATGSGFVLDKDGDIVTNEHVVDGASKIEVGLGKNKTVEAKVVGVDASNDLALLKVNADKSDLHPLRLGDSDQAQVGDPVVAIGNPFGLDRTVTTGIVSAKQRELTSPNGFTIKNVLQTDAAINPGNSGGPLLDSRGRVLGINSQIATAGGTGSIGIGFAVPVNTTKRIVSELKSKGSVQHAFLGVTGVGITDRLSSSLNLPATKGVLVQRAVDPAKAAGIKGGDTQVSVGGSDIVLGGDVITAIDGKKVTSMDDVIGVVDTKKPGDKVTVELARGSGKRTVTVTLGKRPASADSSFQSGQSGGGSQQQQLPGLTP
jgi:S1-C subfamily serine protease